MWVHLAHAEDAQRVAGEHLPRAEGEYAALGADGVVAPLGCAVRIGGAHAGDVVTGNVRAVDELDPQGWQA